jgi:hypothetical protein
MTDFGFLLKSYGADFGSVKKLVSSFHDFNVECLPMHIVVPKSDVQLFETFSSASITIVNEESVDVQFAVKPVNGIRPGYINQEIVKLAYHLTNSFDNYLCLDSDAVFVRPFSKSDFMAPDGNPYTVLVEDRDLQTDADYFREHWTGRQLALDRIRTHLGIKPNVTLLTCHGFQILNSKVLRGLEAELFGKNNVENYLDLLAISPYEFSWYNFFIQSRSVIPLHIREPYFRVLHTGKQFALSKFARKSKADWARGYLGVVLNSNFQVGIETRKGLETPSFLVFAAYLSLPELASLIIDLFAALTIRTLAVPFVVIRRILKRKNR